MIEAFKSTKGGYDFNLCFDHLRPILKSADLSIGNLETPISETAPYRGEILTHEGPFYCNAPIEYLEALQYAGFDMLTTANNHCLDAGARGLLETISNIKALGFIQTGTFVEQEDKFVIVDVCGFKIGITAFSVTYNTMDSNLTKAGKVTLLNHYSKENAHKIYTKMKNKGAEFVICCPHWGREFTNILSNKQMQMAEELSEMGYDFIAGSHSHVVQKFQYINNTPVIFSLGNLITHMNNMGKSAQDTQYPVIGALKLARKNNQIESNIKFIPCRILKNENKIPFQVIPITSHLRYDALATPLKDVPAKIANLLEVNLDSLETNFPITADAVKHFKTAKELQEDRSTKLIPMVKHNGTSRKIYKDISQNPEENIVHDAVGTYKIHQNFAELIAIDSNASVIRLNKEIKNIPLKRICLPQVKNATTRVVYIGAFTEYISAYSFKNYTKLESIRLFNNLKEIGNNAFENCSAMMGIILPVSLEVLGNEAFKNCGNLLSIKIPTTVKKIGQDAFVGCNKLIIYCEENSYAHEYAKANNIRVKFMPLPRIKNAKYEMIPSKTLSIKEGFHPQITIKEIYDTLAADISTYTGNFSIDEQVYNIVIRNEDLHEDCVAVIDEGQPDSIIKIQNAINSHVALIITTKQIDGIPCLVVKKPRQAYRKLISYIKSKYDLYTVAVTGSIGKTTCTAIIKNVMKEKYNVLDVRGNYNTYKTIGLCVQKLTPAHTAYVQEMHGASIGHGAKNAAMIQPNIGVITNIGASHLEQVGGTIEDVLREKLGIIKGLKEGGKLFINNDNKYLQNIKVPVTLVTYAVYNENSDYYAQNIVEYGDRTEFQIVCQKGIFNACVFSPGIHNVGNAIVAFAIGCDAGIDPEKILSAISKVETTGIRQNIVNRGGKTLYIDCYNANPESTAGAMKTLKKLSTGITGRHIAVVGDIAELGDESPKWHAYLAEKAYEAGMDCLVTFGRDTLHTHQRALELGIEAYHFSFEQRDDMEKWLSAQVHEGDCVLFKGSRICALEHSIKRVFPPNKSAKKEKI